MTALVRSRRFGAYQAGKFHTLATSRLGRPDATKPGIVYCPGRGGTDVSFLDQTANLASPGGAEPYRWVDAFPVASLATNLTWANAPIIQEVLNLRALLQTEGAFKAGKSILFGGSMGGLTALNVLRFNPTLFSAVVLIVPAVSLAFHHDNGYEVEMDAAYTNHAGYLTALTTHSPYAAPASYDVGVPILAFISDNDTTAPFGLAQTFIDAIPSAERRSLGAVGHAAYTSSVDYEGQALDFFLENA